MIKEYADKEAEKLLKALKEEGNPLAETIESLKGKKLRFSEISPKDIPNATRSHTTRIEGIIKENDKYAIYCRYNEEYYYISEEALTRLGKGLPYIIESETSPHVTDILQVVDEKKKRILYANELDSFLRIAKGEEYWENIAKRFLGKKLTRITVAAQGDTLETFKETCVVTNYNFGVEYNNIDFDGKDPDGKGCSLLHTTLEDAEKIAYLTNEWCVVRGNPEDFGNMEKCYRLTDENVNLNPDRVY